MWLYEKRLIYPVRIKRPNARLAKAIISQLGGPDGEATAAIRYLAQRYAMPFKEAIGVLTDVGTEELAHMEVVGALIHQLTRNLSEAQLKEQGIATYDIDSMAGAWPADAAVAQLLPGSLSSKGDPIADLHDDLAAEQRARSAYENLLRIADDPDVIGPLQFLRAREIVHYQRFGEALRIACDRLDSHNLYAFNPAFDLSRGASRLSDKLPVRSMEGCSEGVEYVSDECGGRYRCRSTGEITYQ